MSFETYQLVGNEDHTPGCRRTGSGFGASAHRSQHWLCMTPLPGQIEMFQHHKFPPRTAKPALRGHTAIASETHQAHRFYLHYCTPKMRFWLRGSIYNPFCECWPASVLAHNAWAWGYHHQERDAAFIQRVLTQVLSSQGKQLQSGAAAAKKKQKHRICG